ncbi:unnamed protein product [Pylaiella littoralis]
MRAKIAAPALALACSGLTSTRAFTGPALATCRSSSRSTWSVTSLDSSTASTVDAATAPTAADEQYSPPKLVEALREVSSQAPPLGVEGVFSAMARDDVFMNELWQKKPFFCDASLASLAGQYTLDDFEKAVDGDFVEAGRGTFSQGASGWRMAPVSTPRGKSFEDAKLRFEDVQKALQEKSGTVVVNSAGAYVRPLAGICLEVMEALDIPVCLNLYITAAGQKTSAPPHTDKQDVFVMQTQGRKRWRVFSPPPPQAKPKADPMARGKGADVLSLDEVVGEGKEGALVDVVLEPGQFLYVPAGFPHTTDTVTGMSDGDTDPSVHLTVGVDTHIWGLNYATLRSYSLSRSGMQDEVKKPLEKSVGEPEYWRLFSALPLGFLGEGVTAGLSRWSEMKKAQLNAMTSTASRLERDLQPGRWDEGVPDEEVLGGDKAQEVAQKLIDHHSKITNIFKEMYGDVRYGLSDVPKDSCFLRSRPYLDLIERTMSQLVQWGGTGASPALAAAGAGAGAGAGGQPTAAAAAVPKAPSVSGFGGGVAVAAAKKGGGGKKKKSKKK